MWLQFSSEACYLIVGAVIQYRDKVQRDLDAGIIPFPWDRDSMISEIIMADRIANYVANIGSLAFPSRRDKREGV